MAARRHRRRSLKRERPIMARPRLMKADMIRRRKAQIRKMTEMTRRRTKRIRIMAAAAKRMAIAPRKTAAALR